MTELKILTGHVATDPTTLQECATIFKSKYPNTKLVVTSIKQTDNTSGVAVLGNQDFYYTLEEMPKDYGGTGDALVSQFILNHFYKSMPFNEALKLATDKTYVMIKKSYEAGADQLLY